MNRLISRLGSITMEHKLISKNMVQLILSIIIIGFTIYNTIYISNLRPYKIIILDHHNKQIETYNNTKKLIYSKYVPLNKEVYQYAYSRGQYDQVHNLTDYRADFRKNAGYITGYISFNININGTQDPRSISLDDQIFNIHNNYEYSLMCKLFIRGYDDGFQRRQIYYSLFD